MQKRRGHHNNSRLPLTEADAVKMNGGMSVIFGGSTNGLPGKTRRRKVHASNRRSRKNRRLLGAAIATGLVVVTGLYLMVFSSSVPANESDGRLKRILHRQRRNNGPEIPRPLEHFPTLQYPLANANLVGLYFAASWCRFSLPATEALDELFGEIILPPLDQEDGPPEEKAPLAIVHVSSDKKKDEYEEYVRKNWIPVPFDSHEQTALKRHFSTCAKYEVESLGLERQYEIPTLLIIDSKTQTVLTANGVDDLEEYEDNALDHWKELQNLVRAMEEKYAGDEDGETTPLNGQKRQKGTMKTHNNNNNAEAISSLFGPN